MKPKHKRKGGRYTPPKRKIPDWYPRYRVVWPTQRQMLDYIEYVSMLDLIRTRENL